MENINVMKTIKKHHAILCFIYNMAENEKLYFDVSIFCNLSVYISIAYFQNDNYIFANKLITLNEKSDLLFHIKTLLNKKIKDFTNSRNKFVKKIENHDYYNNVLPDTKLQEYRKISIDGLKYFMLQESMQKQINDFYKEVFGL